MNPGELVAEIRRRHGLDQRTLARRARTSQGQISRIERGEISPTVATLERLLASMGEQLQLAAEPLPHGNRPTQELQDELQRTTPEQRIRQTADLSAALTSIAARARTDRD
jgi:transcriptional regulator with XRE-family HTH domain